MLENASEAPLEGGTPIETQPPPPDPVTDAAGEGAPPKSASAGSSARPAGLPSEQLSTRWKDPTDEYELPSQAPLCIEAKELQEWIATLLTHRILVLRGLDPDVLFAAEHAVAGASPFDGAGFVRRSVRRAPVAMDRNSSKTSKEPAPGKRDKAERGENAPADRFPQFNELLDARIGDGPMIVLAAAYEHPDIWRLTESLPPTLTDLDRAAKRLERQNRYLLILTTPADSKFTTVQTKLKAFCHVADFIYPILTDADPLRTELPEQLRQQYDGGLWTGTATTDARLDTTFYEQISSDLANKKLVDLIDAGQKIIEKKPPDVRTAFAEEAARIRAFQRKCGWPAQDRILEQTALFVAAYLEGIPAADFDRVMLELLGSKTRRTPVPVRGVRREEKATTVRVYEEVPLATLWDQQRNRLLTQLGLRALMKSGKPAVDCAGDAVVIQQAFGAMYPFTYADLWSRGIAAGLTFDPSDEVAKCWNEALVNRIVDDAAGFGRTFLIELLLCDEALGKLSGDFGERFDELNDNGRDGLVLARIGELLSVAIVRGRHEAVATGLNQLIGLRAPGAVLRLLWRLSTNVVFPLAIRLKIVQRILNQGGKQHWDAARALLVHWCGEAKDGAALLAMSQWFPENGGADHGPEVEAAGVLIDLAAQWFVNKSGPAHPLAEIVGSTENPAELLASLVKWIFHPSFEAACGQRELLEFFGYWLLSGQTAQLSVQERERLVRLHRDALNVLESETAQVSSGAGGAALPPETAAVRHCQAVILADWAGALDRAENGAALFDLLVGALTQFAPAEPRRQVRAVLQALYRTGSWIRGRMADRTWDTPALREVRVVTDLGKETIQTLLERWKPSLKGVMEAGQ